MLQSDSDDDDEIEKLDDLAGTELFGKKDYVFIDNLPKEKHEIAALLKEVNKNIARLEEQFFIEEDSDAEAERFGLKDMPTPGEHNQRLEVLKHQSNIQQFWSIPLCRQIGHPDAADLFDELAAAQLKHANGRLFDVITCDPPWQLSTANPTRGVAIAYNSMHDERLKKLLRFDKLQKNGFLFVWVINAKYRFAIEMMDHYGYTLVDEIAWVK